MVSLSRASFQKALQQRIKAGPRLAIRSTSGTPSSAGHDGSFGLVQQAYLAAPSVISRSKRKLISILILWLLMFVVGLSNFAHCVATSGEILAAVLRGQA